MKVFQVRQGSTGTVLWTGSAASELQALDAMAHGAGYYDHSDLPDHVSLGGLSVEVLAFDPTPSPSTDRTVTGGRNGQTAARGGFDVTRTARTAARL